jgi:hypothetical protein
MNIPGIRHVYVLNMNVLGNEVSSLVGLFLIAFRIS